MAEGAFGLYADDGEGSFHHALDDLKNVLLAREGHLQVELRKLELAVRAKVFVAEATHDLEIAVHAGNHQDLFEDLRRLRQRVKLSVVYAAGNQAIAGAFGCGTREHGRLNFEEAEFVKRLANFQDDAVAQLQVAMWFGPPQVEIAISEARFLARGHFFFNLKRRRLRIIQDVQAGGHYFHFAGSNFRIGLLAAQDTAFHRNNKLRAQLFGFSVRFGVQLLVEDNLCESGAVAQVDKNQLAQIAPAMDPAH